MLSNFTSDPDDSLVRVKGLQRVIHNFNEEQGRNLVSYILVYYNSTENNAAYS